MLMVSPRYAPVCDCLCTPALSPPLRPYNDFSAARGSFDCATPHEHQKALAAARAAGTRSAKGCAAASRVWKSSWFLINHRETEENRAFPLHPPLPLESQSEVSKEKLCKPQHAKVFIIAGMRRLRTIMILTFMNAKPVLCGVCVMVHGTMVCASALL